MTSRPARRVPLLFTEESRAGDTHVNLSAVRHDGDHLWVAGDETATVERLTAHVEDGAVVRYDRQVTVALGDLVDLPAGSDEEADVEGLARAGDHLWAVGSHSLKRKRIRDRDRDAKARKRLRTVVREENRYVVVRLPVDPATGLPAREVHRDGEVLTSAVLAGDDALTELLADDDLLAPFTAIPSKDNGVDVEGVAVHLTADGELRLYLGFRGPVLRGWAVLLETRPVTHPEDPHRLELGKFSDGETGSARYRLHLLDLGGLGIRDLCPDGDDLLVLAGPSMSLSGPVRVHRWTGAARTDAADVVRADQLPVELELPHGDGVDHPEGIALVPARAPGGRPQLLVVLDSPAPDRHVPGGMLADVHDLPGR
ncbi:DUF3616 domain-containing protein [Kineococcus sp. SYSU DK004]|uniref:DUF3616 domain-containing protein n=1 Tax=Kineococcus sp. SYSU DK004 TaxID=3383125 RepID=UPI003D7DDA62